MSRDARHANHRRARDIALLMTGIVIGSVIALHLAPSSGEELRYAIRRSYRKATKKIGRYADELRDRADDLLEHTNDLRELGSKLLHLQRGSRAA